MFDGKIYMFQRLPISSSSSPNIFTEFMHFPIWAMKQDRPDLDYKEVDESIINLNNFIKDAYHKIKFKSNDFIFVHKT